MTAVANCAWTASPDSPWITITSGSSASGPGAFAYAVSANTGAARTGRIVVGGEVFTLVQDAAAQNCSYTLAPSSQAIGAAGGAGTPIGVGTAASCAWSASTAASWLHFTGSSSGTGPGSIAVNADANTGAARSGTISVNGQSVAIDQAGALPAACAYTVAPLSFATVAALGSIGSQVTVTGNAGCASNPTPWTAQSGDPWITITAGAPGGSGTGQVVFSVVPNAGAGRSGSLTIAGATVTVTQDPLLCNYSLSPAGASVGSAAGGPTQIAVTTPLGALCSWTASTADAWLRLTGTTGGTLDWSYDANTGPPRTGTITVVSNTSSTTPFSVTQASGCTFTLNKTSESVHKNGRTEQVRVMTAPGCTWTATTQATWITITSGASGSGNGTVVYDVPANNTGADRTDTIVIAGLTFTVTQDH